ncbi:hypothetical protein CDD80_5942 [Ophiocordyceps camponoti-rufipedis]|uniref:Transmembrane protein n=1 Tax=Ophiocordyceps camponoti-rufipedis TaxID=2004952 RepID=A0A2C5YP39_9HYPO|nr:hypothetical protein CDD80_5942 [Ophiocordyceps camponoti-rufipedis]
MNSQASLEPSAASSPVSNGYSSSESMSSVCSSTQRQPPAYGDEPPNYQGQEELLSQVKARERKTIFIRLLSSIFITVLVSLIVAAVVERIHDNRGDVHHEVPTRSVEKITVISTPPSGSATAESAAAVTSESLSESPSDPPSEPPSSTLATVARPSSDTPASTTIDCSSMSLLSSASLLTSFRQQPTRRNAPPVPKPTAGEPQMRDMAVYSFKGCLWSHVFYHAGDGTSQRCIVSCPGGKADGKTGDGKADDGK